MDDAPSPTAWTLAGIAVLTIALITAEAGYVLIDVIAATGIATADGLIWLLRQGA